MANGYQPHLIRFRLIITRRKASEILLSTGPSGRSLPEVEASGGARLTGQFVARVRQAYHLETCCLSTNGTSLSPDVSFSERYPVLETLDQDAKAPAATMWLSSPAAASAGEVPAADRSAISTALEELGRYIAEPAKGPFARPGWMEEELLPWVQDVIRPLGLRATGKFEQLNASPMFSLLRMETNGRAVWFKATGEPNLHELPVSVALSGLFPNCVPRVLGVHPIWNAWLSEEAPGQTLDDCTDLRAWARAATVLAELQIASVPRTESLIEAGSQDLRLHQLESRIDPFLRRMSHLMSRQPKEPPQILNDAEIRLLGDCLKAAFSEFKQHRMPDALGHLDIHPANIVVSPAACCFLDWAKASVTHPLFTFEYFREQARRSLGEPDQPNGALTAAYLEPWQSLCSREALTQAMAYSPVLAVFAYAVASKKWSSPEALRNAALGGYFRSLARRAYREAAQIGSGRKPCRV